MTATGEHSAATSRARRWPRALPAYPLLIFLAVAFVFPVAQLLWLSFATKQGSFTLDHYVRFFASPVYLQVLLITIKIAFFTTLLCIIGGYPVAYLLSAVPLKRRNTLILWSGIL